MNETDAYRQLYGDLVNCPPHYWPRLGWLNMTKTCSCDHVYRHYVNGTHTAWTQSFWTRFTKGWDTTVEQSEEKVS